MLIHVFFFFSDECFHQRCAFFVVVQLVFFHMITCEIFFFKDVIVHLHVGASFILLLTLFVEIRHVWGMLFFLCLCTVLCLLSISIAQLFLICAVNLLR